MNKFQLFHDVVSLPEIRKFWMSASLYGQKLTSREGSSLLNYSPKSMAYVGDSIMRSYVSILVYNQNPQGSAHLLSSSCTSMVENEFLSYLYDHFNMANIGPRVSHIKPKADSVEQLIGIILAQWGFPHAWAMTHLLFSNNDDVDQDLSKEISELFSLDDRYSSITSESDSPTISS